jgi:hypothetical protein
MIGVGINYMLLGLKGGVECSSILTNLLCLALVIS